MVLGPRLYGDDVRNVQKSERAREDRGLVSHGTQTPSKRHRNQRTRQTLPTQLCTRRHRRQAKGIGYGGVVVVVVPDIEDMWKAPASLKAVVQAGEEGEGDSG